MLLKMTKQAHREIGGLDPKQFRQVVGSIDLLKNSAPQDGAPLKGAKNGERRVGVGEYRIVYAVADDVVEILLVGKRNDSEIYKMFDRLSR